VLGTLSKREKSDWRSLAKSSQTCTSLWCTRLSGSQAGASVNWLLSEKVGGAASIIHWTIQCASRAPSQRSIERSTGDTWLSQRSGGVTGLSGVPGGPWLTMAGFAKKGRKLHTVHCPVVHRTVRCVHRQKAIRAFQMELKRLLAALGL
jgi:hypothetical protein